MAVAFIVCYNFTWKSFPGIIINVVDRADGLFKQAAADARRILFIAAGGWTCLPCRLNGDKDVVVDEGRLPENSVA